MEFDLKAIGERVAYVRNQMNISRNKFGEPLGLSGDEINNIERARVKNAPISKMKLICATFGVDYHWLTTGEGDMLHVSDNALADRIEELLEGENETAKAIFKALAAFDESDWKTVQKFIDELKNYEP